MNTCSLVGCTKDAFKGFSTCGRTHGKVNDAVSKALKNTDVIEFYDKQNKYYEFTNFYENYRHGKLEEVKFKGRAWRTSEHAFQSEKFNYASKAAQKVFEEILNAQTPKAVFEIAQKNIALVRPDWMKIRDSVMYEVVKVKFSNDHLKNVILKSDPRKLVEASPKDSYWGRGADGKGENKLGKILMRVRYEIQNGL